MSRQFAEALEARRLLALVWPTLASEVSGNDTILFQKPASVYQIVHNGASRNLGTSINGNQITIWGGAGDDDINVFDNQIPTSIAVFIYGDAYPGGPSVTPGNDTLSGGAGADSIEGGGGNDSIITSPGNDTLVGGSGTDIISAQNLTNSLSFVQWSLDGNNSNDTVTWSEGDGFNGGYAVQISGENLRGGAGGDQLTGDANANTLWGGTGNDTIYGSGGADLIYGEGGSDSLFGEGGNDTIYGDAGSDYIDGGSELDDLYGGSGAGDAVYGRAGNDRFWLADSGAKDSAWGGSGTDTVLDRDTVDVLAEMEVI